MQCGFFDSEYITMNSLQVIYDSHPFVFGILSSRLHMQWVKIVAGRLKEDYRYSTQLCYNTFPFPDINDEQKRNITTSVHKILNEREKFSEKKIAELYDPQKMPTGLKEAHNKNDIAVERCYREEEFKNDEERLEYLFKYYQKMTEKEVSIT